MNERQKRAYLMKKYGYCAGRGFHRRIDELILDEGDREIAVDLELKACARYEREAVRSGRMTWEEILRGQAKTWKEVTMDREKANVR